MLFAHLIQVLFILLTNPSWLALNPGPQVAIKSIPTMTNYYGVQLLADAQVTNKPAYQHTNASDIPSFIATGKKISKILNNFFEVSAHN